VKSSVVKGELTQIETIKGLTGIFESIASIRIARTKNRVLASQGYFNELWQIYAQLRIDPRTQIGSRQRVQRAPKSNAFLVITSEGGLSGDIDTRIVEAVARQYDPATTDIILLGAHGQALLAQHGITPTYFYRLPDTDQPVDVRPIVDLLSAYAHPTAYYQNYVSLAVQEVGRIDLLGRVQALGQGSEQAGEIISAKEYLFEPDVDRVVEYLESIMLGIAIGQLILQSRLAQYASRFSAMYAASETAGDLAHEVGRRFRRTKRAESDERTKEIINAMVARG
jgi:ATP synthase F1 gamma subunit